MKQYRCGVLFIFVFPFSITSFKMWVLMAVTFLISGSIETLNIPSEENEINYKVVPEVYMNVVSCS